MKKPSKAIVLVLTIGMLITACGQSPSPSPSTPAATPSGAPAPSSAPATPAAPKTYSLGSSGTTGAQYIIGVAMANEINKTSATVNIGVQATSGASENINLVNGGEMDFGWGNNDTIYNYINGLDYVAPSDKTENIVGVMALQPAFGQFMVRKDANIKSIGDLKGKRVMLGTTSASVYNMSRKILEYYGIDPDKDISAELLSQQEGANKLSDGDLDAMFIMAGVPTAAYTNLTIDNKYAMINIDRKDLEQIVATTLKANEIGVIPKGTYPNIDEDINALYARSCVFTRADLPDEVVYEFCKQVYENWDAIKQGHAVLPKLDVKEFPDVGVKLHPGAEKFYKEIGLL